MFFLFSYILVFNVCVKLINFLVFLCVSVVFSRKSFLCVCSGVVYYVNLENSQVVQFFFVVLVVDFVMLVCVLFIIFVQEFLLFPGCFFNFFWVCVLCLQCQLWKFPFSLFYVFEFYVCIKLANLAFFLFVCRCGLCLLSYLGNHLVLMFIFVFFCMYLCVVFVLIYQIPFL